MTPKRRKLIILGAVLLVVIAAGVLAMRRVPDTVSWPLFVLIVVVEVVIAPIPGGAIGYLGAARFGFWQAWPMLYIGNVIGTALVFWLARRYGTPLFEENVSAKARRRYDEVLHSHPVLLWLVYAVPVIPVDVLSALAGLSSLSMRRFFLIAFTGYAIYTGIVAFVGSSLSHLVGMTGAVSVLGAIFLVGLMVWLWRSHGRVQ